MNATTIPAEMIRRGMIADMSRLGSGIQLVGRHAELTALRDALRRARDGEPAVTLLSGDAGIGKSRVLTELVSSAESEGDTVFVGRCLDTAEAALPYLPFVEIIRQLADRAPELVENRPELQPLLPHSHRAAGSDRELDQLQMFNALLDALNELATDRCVVLGIEDLHWADRSSRDLFAFLASRLSHQRILVVATYRSDDMNRRHPLRSTLAEVVRLRTVERLQLEPFDHDDSRTLVRALAEETLDEDAVTRIAEASEGNAFLAEELVSSPSTGIPRELADLLLARVEWLATPTQQVLRLASAIGREFSHRLLSEASEATQSELDSALREAITHNVLTVCESGDVYQFRHALFREAVYNDLLPGERIRLHQRLAAALADADYPGAAAELAHHNLESGDHVAALNASVRAAAEAKELAAPAETLLHLERALRLWSNVPDPENLTGTTEVSLTVWAGQVAEAAGEPDRAIAHGRAAIELVDHLGDPLRSAAMRYQYARYLLRLDWVEQSPYEVAGQAWALVAETPPSSVKAWVLAVFALAARGEHKLTEAAEHASAAIATAQAIGGVGDHQAAWADALTTRAFVKDRVEKSTDEVLEQFAEAAELARSGGDSTVELRARFQAVLTLHDVARFDEALAEIDAGLERAGKTGTQWSAFGLELRVLQVLTRFMVGDWDGSESAAELMGGAVSGTVFTRISAPGLLVAVNRGRFDVASSRLANLRERWHSDQQVLTVVGLAGAELESWRGRPAEAVKSIDTALRQLDKVAPKHLVTVSLCASGVAACADLADTARAAGDPSAEREAIAHGERLLATAAESMRLGRPVSGSLGPEGKAWWARLTAEESRLRGRSDAELWRETAKAFEYGEPFRTAWAWWRQAEALLNRGDREEAAELLRSAAAVADRLGADPLRAAISTVMGRAGMSGTGSTTSPLTPRESGVLELVARGLTNRQVGAQLYISEKTVSVHLSRVMAKLGAGSRTEAVNTAYQRGLLVRESR